MSYYKVIKGKKYDRELLEAADEAIAGVNDNRISIADAKKLYEKVIDGNSYTDIEKSTVKYIRDNYKWTPKADEWFRAEIRRWATRK